MKRIDIFIDEDGKVHVRFSGFVGRECLAEAERLIAGLKSAGLEVITEKVELTSEYYATAEAKTEAKV